MGFHSLETVGESPSGQEWIFTYVCENLAARRGIKVLAPALLSFLFLLLQDDKIYPRHCTTSWTTIRTSKPPPKICNLLSNFQTVGRLLWHITHALTDSSTGAKLYDDNDVSEDEVEDLPEEDISLIDEPIKVIRDHQVFPEGDVVLVVEDDSEEKSITERETRTKTDIGNVTSVGMEYRQQLRTWTSLWR